MKPCRQPVGHEHWFEVDHHALIQRFKFYADRNQVGQELRDGFLEVLQSSLSQQLLSCSREYLESFLVNDAYKPKMHAVYSEFMPGVEADFVLKIRKSEYSLEKLQEDDPELTRDLQQSVQRLSQCIPYTPLTQTVLEESYNLKLSQNLIARSKRHGVAKVEWGLLPDRSILISAQGPVEAASHVETSCMQLMQQALLQAQVRQICRQTGVFISRTERLANSLARLASMIQQLNAQMNQTVKVALFAGRRSSDRVYLALQILLCCKFLNNYAGTSSIFVGELVSDLGRQSGKAKQSSRQLIGRLIGTHAHEQQSLTGHLLSLFDDQAGEGQASPCAISSMVGHLLFLLVHGKLEHATALSDTFGTGAFLVIALAADIPQEFIEDVAQRHGEVVKGSKCIDLFRIYRLDSGDYVQTASQVVAVCKERARECKLSKQYVPPPPKLMHSNLGSAEEVIAVSQLDESIRPFAVGFGTLADGYTDFPHEKGTFRLQLASIVMKAVFGKCEGVEPSPGCPCAGKLGDGLGKEQVDPRLPLEQQLAMTQRLKAMGENLDLDPQLVSSVLQRAYVAVTRDKILAGGALK